MILLCAATGTELDACKRGTPRFAHLLTGVGAVHAARALSERLVAGERPSLVVSSGFAGALRGDLPVGTWVTARTLPAAGTLREAPPPAVPCAMVSSDVLVQGQRLDGDAVDMESVALAAVAHEHGLPFMVLRLVSDTPADPLPRFLGGFTDAMAATSRRGKLGGIARGLRGVLDDPRGVVRVVREGRAWTRDLERGWTTFAPLLSDA